MEKIKHTDFMRLVNYMRDTYGVNLEQKLTLVEGRLWSVMEQKGFATLGEYFDYVVRDQSGREAKTLVTRLTTNYSYFMREEQHYKYMTDVILPDLVARLRPHDMRIWSAGCSSGEEAFTTAMVIDDYFGGRKGDWDTKILATDISPQVLSMAAEAVYPEERLQNLSASWRAKYFVRLDGDRYCVSDAIRGEVIFRSFNLMEKTLPFKKKFHLIFCRNVMIYFDKSTRDALVERFYDALEPGGHLFIGLSETVNKTDTRFAFVKPSIYKKGERL